jgi:beta-lactamase regulating signal transducer with metallopeptidase domain
MVYWLFLRRETLFAVNRFYLLSALLLSLLLPLVTIRYSVAASAEILSDELSDSLQVVPILQQGKGFFSATSAFLPVIYLIGVILFFLRIMWQFVILFILIVKNGVRDLDGARVVHNRHFVLPFSFMNLVFINPESIRETEISDIIAHEKVHIREKHWLDLLVVELMSIFLWFNPFIWFFERSIKQNHEYLADKGVVAQGFNVTRYHSVLLNQFMGMEVIGITNNLNYSLNAKRLKMMNKKITPKAKAVHLLWALPVVALLLVAFAQPEYQQMTNDVTMPDLKEVTLTALVLDANGDPVPGASVIVKGKPEGTITSSEGEFTLKVVDSEVVIIRHKGYKDAVIHVEKLVAKQGESGPYKFKVKLEKAGVEKATKMSKDEQIKELEIMLKKLALQKDELNKSKVKLAEVEKEGSVDQEILDKKKQALKEEYTKVNEETKKVEMKLKSLKK